MLAQIETKVISMVHSGQSVAKILAAIRSEYPSFTVSYGRIRRFAVEIRKRMKDKPSEDRKQAQRKFSDSELKLIAKSIESALESDSSATAARIRSYLRTRNQISVSSSYLRRLRAKLGYRSSAPKYCHLIRNPNKAARVRWIIIWNKYHFLLNCCCCMTVKVCQRIWNPLPEKVSFSRVISSKLKVIQVLPRGNPKPWIF